MPTSPSIAYIEPAVLRWARESAAFSLRRAADEIGVAKWYLEHVEDGGDYLSLPEAERAADVYQRPLAALFLPEPPDEDPQEVQFRRLPGTPEPPWGPEIQLSVRRVVERQQAALEIYEVLDEVPPYTEVAPRLTEIPKERLPEATRELLGVTRETQRDWSPDAYAPFRAWRAAVERLGVLVMQDGPVPVREMRGYASTEPRQVPAILVNNKDEPRARAFTLLHELGHLLLAHRGEPSTGAATEKWCESFAGRVLMPGTWLREDFEDSVAPSDLGRVYDVARRFHVTPLAAAVRVTRAGILSSTAGGPIIGEIQRRGSAGRSEQIQQQTGGSYYVNQVARFGPGYLGLVFAALDNQAVTLPAASALLDGVKVKNFDRLRERLNES